MLIALYVVGGLLAVGMIVGDISSVIKNDFQMANDTTRKIKTFLFQAIQLMLFISLAFSFSWVSVGFIYIKNKSGNS